MTNSSLLSLQVSDVNSFQVIFGQNTNAAKNTVSSIFGYPVPVPNRIPVPKCNYRLSGRKPDTGIYNGIQYTTTLFYILLLQYYYYHHLFFITTSENLFWLQDRYTYRYYVKLE
jgi:hypothetical protein